MSLVYVAQQFTLYVGFLVFLMGMFGNAMVILIFSTERTYRAKPCVIYILVASVHDLLLVLFILSIRIVSVGFGIDVTGRSVLCCKARYYLFCIWAGVSLTCQCLATIDQFLVTSQSVYLRRLSTLKGAYRTIALTVVVWWLHGTPWLFYQDISPVSRTCVYSNAIFLRYIIFFSLVILCLLPAILLAIFGCLAYRNLIKTVALHRQHAHHQMTLMVCLQVCLVAFSGLFNAGWYMYLLVTYGMTKNAETLIREYLTQSIVSLMPYFVSSVSVHQVASSLRTIVAMVLYSNREGSTYSWPLRDISVGQPRRGCAVEQEPI